MSVKTFQRAVQHIRMAEFEFNFDDTMLDITGVSKDFGLTNIAATSFDIIALPTNAVVVGGQIVTRTAFDTAGYAVVLGDSSSANRYHASADLKAAARVALLTPGYKNTGGLKIRIGITNTDVCTAGKMLVQVHYVIEGSAFDVQPY